MASLNEVKAFLKNSLTVEMTDSGGMSTTIGLPSGRSQVVYFDFLEDALNGAVILTSPFATLSDISPKAALETVEEMEIAFGVKLFNGFFVLSHLMPVADLDESEIISGVSFIAANAEMLESNLGLADRF